MASRPVVLAPAGRDDRPQCRVLCEAAAERVVVTSAQRVEQPPADIGRDDYVRHDADDSACDERGRRGVYKAYVAQRSAPLPLPSSSWSPPASDPPTPRRSQSSSSASAPAAALLPARHDLPLGRRESRRRRSAPRRGVAHRRITAAERVALTRHSISTGLAASVRGHLPDRLRRPGLAPLPRHRDRRAPRPPAPPSGAVATVGRGATPSACG